MTGLFYFREMNFPLNLIKKILHNLVSITNLYTALQTANRHYKTKFIFQNDIFHLFKSNYIQRTKFIPMSDLFNE